MLLISYYVCFPPNRPPPPPPPSSLPSSFPTSSPSCSALPDTTFPSSSSPSLVLFHLPSLSPQVPPHHSHPSHLFLSSSHSPSLHLSHLLPFFLSLSTNPQLPYFHTTIEIRACTIRACTMNSHWYRWGFWGRAVCRTRVSPLLREQHDGRGICPYRE